MNTNTNKKNKSESYWRKNKYDNNFDDNGREDDDDDDDDDNDDEVDKVKTEGGATQDNITKPLHERRGDSSTQDFESAC